MSSDLSSLFTPQGDNVSPLPSPMILNQSFGEKHLPEVLALSILILLTCLYTFKSHHVVSYQLPIVNQYLAYEPRFFARLRWAVSAHDILEKALKKVS